MNNIELLIIKSSVDLPTIEQACEKSGCKLNPDHVDHATYRITADDAEKFYELGYYVGKIKAQQQFR